MSDFHHILKTALTGSGTAPLVLVGNFEVEDQWAIGEAGLPRVVLSEGDPVVNRMDEFALLLGGKADHVVLKAAPDPGYVAYLEGLGIDLPRVLTVDDQHPTRTVSQDALASPRLIANLAALAADGARIAPHGVSVLEERLSAATGLPVAGPAAAVCKSVNGKIYSRKLADAVGLRQAAGWTCETMAELRAAVPGVTAMIDAGRRVVAKDAYGVSGKGLLLLDSTRRLDQLLRMAERRATRSGDDGLSILFEEWVAKTTDLNYQFTVDRSGGVHFDFVKEAMTENGVHKGHRMPSRLGAAQVDELVGAAARIGARLAADGYFGVVGVDAMVDPDGGLYPIVEINARNNMSTYQVMLQQRFIGSGQVALARQYPLRLAAPLPFDRLAAALGDLIYRADEEGLLVNNFATVNAAATDAGPGGFDGRLYGLVIAGSDDRMRALDNEIADRVAAVA